jgi:hypothetical protein
MTTTTARVFAEDVERARVIGAVRQQSAHEVIHAALEEYVANHRDELDELFRAVQNAVLAGSRDELQRVLRSGAAARAGADVRRLDEVWGRG